MNKNEFNAGLMEFLDASPSPFHGVFSLIERLNQAGFVALDEAESWDLHTGGQYYVIRNHSSIVAFRLGQGNVVEHGFRMVGAHTDSPCLKVKPVPEINRHSYFQVGVEVYGGVLLNTWFDRDLSLAGRITYLDAEGDVHNALVDFAHPIAVIPSLAIHLNREANKNKTVNPQKELPPIMMQGLDPSSGESGGEFKILLAKQAQVQGISNVHEILDFEMSFYDCQKSALVGIDEDFIASARLDNLLSCYAGMNGLMHSCEGDEDVNAVLVCSDHEEVGSVSAAGAQGPFLKSVLERICGHQENFSRAMARSMMISVDNAHGIHPNYPEKHDALHGPILNKGPVIKVNANQRYATNSETSGIFRSLCRHVDVPVQSFVVRSDMGCGSTIGPITASELGVKTIDVGVPTFAMHSIRELAGADDAYALSKVLKAFYGQVDEES
ncbi:MAG: M18 family aminopeptidase [Gammaproteobacteria bacterium]|nr:MAG: M18 family aminopeptidase [Gammaproteobacteria bacterium]